MSIAGGLIMTTIIGGTLAATSIRSQTLTTQAQITVDNLAISLGTGENEAEYYTVSEISDEQLGNSVVLPNSDIEYNQLVYNDGDYPVYIRVVIEKSWMGEFGNESQPDSSYIELLYNEEDGLLLLQSIPQFYITESPLKLVEIPARFWMQFIFLLQ